MDEFYVIGVDQSTQGTKGVVFDRDGRIIARKDRPHRQIINDKGWVSHDAEEIYQNTIGVLQDVITESGIDAGLIRCMGITNQRETTVAFDRGTGHPLAEAIVWQCNRAAQICDEVTAIEGETERIRKATGLIVSPYYPAGKMAWLLRNEPEVKKAAGEERLALGTIDTYLLYRLTDKASFKTDYSNASRTQLFDLERLAWSEEICKTFQIPTSALAQVCDSDAEFGTTTLEGFLPHPVPIHAMLGDSHGALFGHHCHAAGDIKVTYGTGSSVMLNTGDRMHLSRNGLSTSLAWRAFGETMYVLEGNINYTGATITWLKDGLHLISSAAETEQCAMEAAKEDTTYLVPAFSGLGAPWWENNAKAMICGMTRTTGRNEIVKAGVESIAYQITDVVETMRKDSGLKIDMMYVDGGPTRNRYLMQFQSDIAAAGIRIPNAEELSVIGVAFLAGIAAGVWDKDRVFDALTYETYEQQMEKETVERKRDGWKQAIQMLTEKR